MVLDLQNEFGINYLISPVQRISRILGMGYQKINVIVGWVTFAFSLIVYLITIEDTASFWDCGEFIATAYKLEVPHPPGAPFFLLTGRLFSMLALGDVTAVAYWINFLSVLSSSFTILFLFWSITHLAKKVMKVEDGNESIAQTIAIISSGVVGALTFTFSDSFWFSAVEAEVYAMSSFFTAFVFWAMLKWENIEDESDSNKWLIMIAYMMGLSIGVHLLNLVTIPALALIFYFKRSEKISLQGLFLTLLIGGFIIILINNIIIPGLPSMAGSFEIYFVNSLGLPFGTGLALFLILLLGGLIFGIIYSEKNKKLILNTALLSVTFILIGYSSYMVVLIRSNYDTPIDENNPEDLIKYVSYLKREQYGDRPLLKGQYFTADLVDQKRGKPVYMKGEDKYVIKDYKVDYVYDPKQSTILPRMYSKSANGSHQRRYREITGLEEGQKPTFSDNLEFMFKHQLGHMYFRYFMWNFSGRASDIQDAGWVGLNGAFKKLPAELENNRGRNIYFGIPLLLGLLGMFIQFKNNKDYFGVTALLFFLTGAALVLYLNSPPVEPRERDYIYAGSYYVFAIWVGLGVLMIFDWLNQLTKANKVAALTAGLIGLCIPVLMASENWDDHDRSGRYFSIDAAKNYLDSCAPNAILFTGGDNDTFPLWYVQEVEGYRTDVRVVVLSYFNTDWYIEQMMRQAYESDPLPFGLTLKHYQQGGLNDYLPVVEDPNIKGQAINTKLYLDLIKQEHPGLKVPTSISAYNSVPSRSMFLNVDTTNFSESSELTSTPSQTSKLSQYQTNRLTWNVKGRGLEKKDLAILDLITHSQWKRPIYFNTTSLRSINMDLNKHVVQEGLAYRLMPIEYTPRGGEFLVNVELMYDNLMNKFHWRGLDNPRTYNTEDYRNFCLNHRSAFNSLALALLRQGDRERAKEVLLRSLELIPNEVIPYDFFSVQQVGMLLQVGEKEKAIAISQEVGDRAEEWLEYYTTQSSFDQLEMQRRLLSLNEISRALRANGENDLAAKYAQILSTYYDG